MPKAMRIDPKHRRSCCCCGTKLTSLGYVLYAANGVDRDPHFERAPSIQCVRCTDLLQRLDIEIDQFLADEEE